MAKKRYTPGWRKEYELSKEEVESPERRGCSGGDELQEDSEDRDTLSRAAREERYRGATLGRIADIVLNDGIEHIRSRYRDDGDGRAAREMVVLGILELLPEGSLIAFRDPGGQWYRQDARSFLISAAVRRFCGGCGRGFVKTELKSPCELKRLLVEKLVYGKRHGDDFKEKKK